MIRWPLYLNAGLYWINSALWLWNGAPFVALCSAVVAVGSIVQAMRVDRWVYR